MTDRNLTVNLRLLAPENNKSAAEETTRAVQQTERQVEKTTDMVRRLSQQSREIQGKTSSDIVKSIQAESEARKGASTIAQQVTAIVNRAASSNSKALDRMAEAAKRYLAEMQKLQTAVDGGGDVDFSGAVAAMDELQQATEELNKEEQKRQRWLAIARSRAERTAKAEAKQRQAMVSASKQATEELNKEEQKRQRWLAIARSRAERTAKAEAKLLEQRQAMVSASKQQSEAQQRLGRSVASLANGLTQLARSYVLATVADSKTAQQALQTIARFESVAQAVLGTVNTIQAANSAWKHYRTAVLAAAAADAVKTRSGAAATASSYLAPLSGVASKAGRLGVAALGVAGLYGIARTGDDVFAGRYGQEGSFSAFGARQISRLIPGHSRTFGDADDTANQLANRQNKFAARFARRSANEDAITQAAVFLSSRGATGLERARQQNHAQRFHNARQRDDLQLGVESQFLSVGQRAQNNQAIIDKLQEAVRLEQQRFQISADTSRQEIASAQERHSLATQTLSKLQQERGTILSETERFVNLDPRQRARTIQAADKLRRGERLSREERQLTSGFRGLRELREAQVAREGEIAGAGRVVQGFGKLEDIERQVAQQKIDVAAKAEVILKLDEALERSLKTEQSKFEEVVVALQSEITERTATQLRFEQALEVLRIRQEQN